MLVLLPVYIGFLGVAPSPLFGFLASGYTVLIGFLLVCRLPVWSGKSEGSRIRRDLVLPAILLVVIYVATLMSFTWETMVVTVVAYLATLPFGARSWQRKYGGWSTPQVHGATEFPEETDGH
jgi:CDP-diacylglycerol--serine O-phosphatidyltransferase